MELVLTAPFDLGEAGVLPPEPVLGSSALSVSASATSTTTPAPAVTSLSHFAGISAPFGARATTAPQFAQPAHPPPPPAAAAAASVTVPSKAPTPVTPMMTTTSVPAPVAPPTNKAPGAKSKTPNTKTATANKPSAAASASTDKPPNLFHKIFKELQGKFPNDSKVKYENWYLFSRFFVFEHVVVFFRRNLLTD